MHRDRDHPCEQEERDQAPLDHELHCARIAVGHARKAVFEPFEETLLFVVARLQQQRGERGRKRQCHDAGDDDRYGNRDGELLVQLAGDAGNERDRNEYRAQDQHDRNERAAHFIHRLFRRFLGRQAELGHVVLDAFDHDDRVVDDDADRQHHAEQRQHVDRETERRHADRRADDRDRHGDDRDQRRPNALKEQEDDQDDEHQRFEECMDDCVDRRTRELRRVHRDVVIDSGRKRLFHFSERFRDGAGDLERVRARLLIDDQHGRRLAVQRAAHRIVALAELRVADVLQPHDGATFARGAQDDAVEFGRLGHSPGRGDRERLLDRTSGG